MSQKNIIIIWRLNLIGLVVNFLAAVLIFYSIGSHPCANPFSYCGGTTNGLHIAYIKSPTFTKIGLLLLLIGFFIQLFTHIISKPK
jgi:hypothetical protein